MEDLSIEQAMTAITNALKDDKSYAWGWHCDLAMAAYDNGVENKAANIAAAMFMANCFGVDTSKFDEFKYMFPCENGNKDNG